MEPMDKQSSKSPTPGGSGSPSRGNIMNIVEIKTDAEIRKAVKEIFGAKNARVTKNGEVHVKGTMPNTNKTGWYLLGFTGQTELEEKIWWPDGRLNSGLAK